MRQHSNSAFRSKLDKLVRLNVAPPNGPEPSTSARTATRPQRRLSPDEVAEIVMEYEAGATVMELSIKHGLHRATVGAQLIGMGSADVRPASAETSSSRRLAFTPPGDGRSLGSAGTSVSARRLSAIGCFRPASLSVYGVVGNNSEDEEVTQRLRRFLPQGPSPSTAAFLQIAVLQRVDGETLAKQVLRCLPGLRP